MAAKHTHADALGVLCVGNKLDFGSLCRKQNVVLWVPPILLIACLQAAEAKRICAVFPKRLKSCKAGHLGTKNILGSFCILQHCKVCRGGTYASVTSAQYNRRLIQQHHTEACTEDPSDNKSSCLYIQSLI